MADIELLIKIPDEAYKEIASHTDEAYSFVYLDLDQLGKLDNAIRNGTPLPKGHGRLIDADALEPDCCGEWNGLCVTEDTYKQSTIDSAQTILKADKESE